MEEKKTTTGVKIGFYGGVGSVTGSNFLLESPQVKILIDCGLSQGLRMCDASNSNPFPYPLETVTALIVTHAHIDHIGRIPKLVRDGFKGKVYSTAETKQLAEVMLPDAAHLIAEEARTCGTPAPYTEHDIAPIFEQWETLPYYRPLTLGDFTIMLQNSGHVLGSAMVECLHPLVGKILFTGDLGNSPSLLLKDTDIPENVNYLVMESVYGDRVHEHVDNRLAQLESIIEDTDAKKGTLLIPTFSIERTQNILYEINTLIEKDRIPAVPVFLDSPLAQKVTKIYEGATQEYNEATQQAIEKGDDIFSFKGLHSVQNPQESQDIHNIPGSKIIIAGSGMSNGGRIINHEKQYLGDPNSTLLIVGYQSPGSLGRQLVDGAKEVAINHEVLSVRARVLSVSGYSGHRDMDGLTDFVNATNVSIKKAFIVMGEPKSSQFLAQRLRDTLGVNAVVPTQGDVVELE